MAFSKGPVIVLGCLVTWYSCDSLEGIALDVLLLGTVDSLEGIEGMAFSKGPVIALMSCYLVTVDSLEGIVLDVSLLGVCLINCLFIKFKLAFAISNLPLSIAPTVSRISNIES